MPPPRSVKQDVVVGWSMECVLFGLSKPGERPVRRSEPERERKRLPGLEAFGRARVVDAMVAEFWVGMKWN